MKKILLAIIVILCIILLLHIYNDDGEYVTGWGVVPQTVASSVSGSMVGAGILMIFFGDCTI
jgi:hypothetical protein